ncbi:MAG: hypothetical protein ACJ74H_02010 [Thermoanaerobaculia bacterium]
MSRRVVVLLAMFIGASLASAAPPIVYRYTGYRFNLFPRECTRGSTPTSISCSLCTYGQTLCPDPAKTPYTHNHSVSLSLMLDSALAPNLTDFDLHGAPGLRIVATDGLQTFNKSTTEDLRRDILKISTDAAGNITGWNLSLNGDSGKNVRTFYQSGVAGSASDSGTDLLDFALIRDRFGTVRKPGIWTAGVPGFDSASGFGTAIRVFYEEPRIGATLDQRNMMLGGSGEFFTRGLLFSTHVGMEWAMAAVDRDSMRVGAWASSNFTNGSRGLAHAIAFRTFVNASTSRQTIRVNTLLDGTFDDSIELVVGAAVRVCDGDRFWAILSGRDAAAYLLGGDTDTLNDPARSLAAVHGQIQGSLLREGTTIVSSPSPSRRVSVPVSSGLFTIEPQQAFVVMFDLVTSSTKGGNAFFADTLSSAATFFEQEDGTPAMGITIADVAPEAAPTASAFTITPDDEQSFTVQVTLPDGTPAAAASVNYVVISGPNAGLRGGALTDAGGEVTLSYTGSVTGTDIVQISVENLPPVFRRMTWGDPVVKRRSVRH